MRTYSQKFKSFSGNFPKSRFKNCTLYLLECYKPRSSIWNLISGYFLVCGIYSLHVTKRYSTKLCQVGLSINLFCFYKQKWMVHSCKIWNMNTTSCQLNNQFSPNKKLCRGFCRKLENSFDRWSFTEEIFQQHSLKFDSMKASWTSIRHIIWKYLAVLTHSGNCHSHPTKWALNIGTVSI